MKTIHSITIIMLLCVATISYSQDNFKNVIELNTEYGFSNDFGAGETYKLFTFPDQSINVENRSLVRTRNTTLAYSRFLNPSNGIKVSFGFAKYGFDVNGISDVTNTPFNGTYKITFLEWGLSYIRRVPINPNYKLLIEPGLRYHSDGSFESNGISISRKDAFSFSLYSGIETPMMGESFFANVGLLIKFPVERYDYTFAEGPAFYPYFIGFRIGVNWQL